MLICHIPKCHTYILLSIVIECRNSIIMWKCWSCSTDKLGEKTHHMEAEIHSIIMRECWLCSLDKLVKITHHLKVEKTFFTLSFWPFFRTDAPLPIYLESVPWWHSLLNCGGASVTLCAKPLWSVSLVTTNSTFFGGKVPGGWSLFGSKGFESYLSTWS